MSFLGAIMDFFGWGEPKPQPKPQILHQPSADSSITARFFDLNICIKQHVENFSRSQDPLELRREIGMKIFNRIAHGFHDSKMPSILSRFDDQPYIQHVNVIWKTGQSVRDLLLQQPHGIWKWGQWDNPDGYIVVFPSIWKAGLMVREWEIVKR